MDLNLRDIPSKKLLESYKERFTNVDTESVLLFLDIQNSYRTIKSSYDTLLSEYGLTEAKFIVLMLLYREQNWTLLPSILAEKSGVSKATMSGVIKGLEGHALVSRVSCAEDKRATEIRLTNNGAQLLETFLPINYKSAHLIMSCLSHDEKQQLTQLLAKIRAGNKKFIEEMEIN